MAEHFASGAVSLGCSEPERLKEVGTQHRWPARDEKGRAEQPRTKALGGLLGPDVQAEGHVHREHHLGEMRPLEEASFQMRGERQMHLAEVHPWDRQFKPGFRLQAEMAVAAALGHPSQCPTLDDAVETMRLIAAIYRND